MGEKTLLELLKEQKIEVPNAEKEVETPKNETKKEVKEEKKINVFSNASFPQAEIEKLKRKYSQEEEEEEREIAKIESKVGSVIETPNYDNIETLSEEQRKKIFVVQKEKEKKANKFKIIIISILFAIFTMWSIINIATIDNISGQISEVTSEYKLNLPNYLKNLYMLDATNSENMENLFETIPESSVPPNKIEEQSNWFDRFCNFLIGLFGG